MSTEKAAYPFTLAEEKINLLESYFRRILRFLMYQLDDEFQFMQQPDQDWTVHGSTLVELFKAADPRAFEMIVEGMVRSMLKTSSNLNPHVAVAMAESGMTRNKIFEEVLEKIREKAGADGALPLGFKSLGRGKLHATLWNVKILLASPDPADRTGLVEPAMGLLEGKLDELLAEPPDLAALYLKLAVATGSTAGVERCLEHLAKGQGDHGRWDEPALGLAVEGELASALAEALPALERKQAGGSAKAVIMVERWLSAAFGLDQEGEPSEWPEPLMACRQGDHPQMWVPAWIKVATASAHYLAVRRPHHSPVAFLLGMSVPQDNMLARAEEMLRLSRPFLPPLQEIKDAAGPLSIFWGRAAPLEKSVNIMCGGEASPEQSSMVQAVTETLWKHKLVGRYLNEGGIPQIEDPWENAALYMTGCRFGVVILAGDGAGKHPPPELVFQTGFMHGQGKLVLVLWDQALGKADQVSFPGVQVPVKGIEAKSFDSTEENLEGLRKTVEAWIKPEN